MTTYGVGGDGRPTLAAQLPTHGNAQHTVAVAPTTSAVGDAAAEGASAAVARADHLHGREAFAAPAASAVGDAQGAGVAATVPRSDHVHAREAFAAAATLADVAATASAAGTATTLPRADHTHRTAVINADGLSVSLVIRIIFAAGVAGTADDVVIYSANAPRGFRILDSTLLVSTAIAASTCTLRSATGGLGTALSDALSSGATGQVRDAAKTATGTIAANGTLVVRRSDRGVAGEFIVLLVPTS